MYVMFRIDTKTFLVNGSYLIMSLLIVLISLQNALYQNSNYAIEEYKTVKLTFNNYCLLISNLKSLTSNWNYV